MREQEDGTRKVEPCSPHNMSTTESSRYWDASRSDSRKDHSSRGSSHRDLSHRHSHGSGRSSADDPAFAPTRSKSSVPSNARTHPVADLRKDSSSRYGASNHMHNHVSEESSRDRKRRRSEDEDEVWTEHRSSSGRIYFYNKKLDKSQWERPAKGLVKKAKPESQSATKSSASTSGGSSSSRASSHSSSRTYTHSSSSTGTGSSGGKSSREHHPHSSTGSGHTPSRYSHSIQRERSAGNKSSSMHHSGQRSGSHSAVSSPSTPVILSKKPAPAPPVVSPSSQPHPSTPQTPTLPFPPPFLNHTPRFPPPPFGGAPESPIVVSAPQLPPPHSSSVPFGPGAGQQNGPMIRPVPMPMSWVGGVVQPHPGPPPPTMEAPGLHPLQKALFLQNQLAQPQTFVTSPAQLPLYALPQPPPQMTTPPPAMPQIMMGGKPITPAELQSQQQAMVLQQPQQLLMAQQQQTQQTVFIKPSSQVAAQQQQQIMPAQALPSSHVLRTPMSRLGTRLGNEIISAEFPDPASLKPPPPHSSSEFFSRVLSDTWWTTALDTCCKQMDRSHLECLSRNNVDSAYHSGQLARNLLNVECCRMIAVSRTTRLTHLRELMNDIAGSKY